VGEYYLLVEAYPVFVENSKEPQRQFTSLNRIITTPIWDKERPTRGGNFLPKRNAEGVIQCRTETDQEHCKFAHKFCQLQQADFDNRALYPELYLQKQEADRKADLDFVQYFRDLINRRRSTVANTTANHWGIMLRHVEAFADGKPIRFGDLTPQWLSQFREFLMTAPVNKGKTLSPNTQKVYLTIFKTVLHTAYKEEILPTDLTLKIEAIKGEETQRVYLTEKELQHLANTPCRNDDTRRAALFSALTGLRYSDILKLTWGEVDSTEMRIEFRQKKTKSVMYLPISQYALALCGERKKDDIPVFSKLPDSKLVSTTIAAWVKSAGITKHITFHCFRHTFATLQLAKGTDIYTVSKMLGHNDVKTTQIYAQVIDEKKQAAANAIKLDI
jgi:integrase